MARSWAFLNERNFGLPVLETPTSSSGRLPASLCCRVTEATQNHNDVERNRKEVISTVFQKSTEVIKIAESSFIHVAKSQDSDLMILPLMTWLITISFLELPLLAYRNILSCLKDWYFFPFFNLQSLCSSWISSSFCFTHHIQTHATDDPGLAPQLIISDLDLFPDPRTHVSECLLSTPLWIFNRGLKTEVATAKLPTTFPLALLSHWRVLLLFQNETLQVIVLAQNSLFTLNF